MTIGKIIITTFLWNEPEGRTNHLFLYNAESVNTFRRMIDRNLSHPHDFCCITDMPEGIDKDIKIVPLPRFLLQPRTRFPKLAIFHPWANKIIGNIIWSFDLDTVIVNKIDPLLEKFKDTDLVLWQNPNWPQPGRTRFNSSTILLKAGSRPNIWNNYKIGIEDRDDQDWITKNVSEKEICWTDEDGIYWSYLIEGGLPANAKIVTFAGRRGPLLKVEQDLHPWIVHHYR